MKIEIELWHVILLMITLVGAYAGIAQMLMSQYTQRIDERFVAVAAQISGLGRQGQKYADDVLKLERELGNLRVEMMRDYTRREDHNAAISSIRIGLDNMSLRIESVLLKKGRGDV